MKNETNDNLFLLFSKTFNVADINFVTQLSQCLKIQLSHPCKVFFLPFFSLPFSQPFLLSSVSPAFLPSLLSFPLCSFLFSLLLLPPFLPSFLISKSFPVILRKNLFRLLPLFILLEIRLYIIKYLNKYNRNQIYNQQIIAASES